MNAVLERLAVWSWQNAAAASALAVVLLLARVWLGRIAPLWLYVGGWLVMARLLLPEPLSHPWAWDRAWAESEAPAVLTTLSRPEPAPVFTGPPESGHAVGAAAVVSAPVAVAAEFKPQNLQAPEVFPAARSFPADPLPAETRSVDESPSVSLLSMAAWVWAAGSVFCFSRFVSRHHRFIRRLAPLLPLPDTLLRSAAQVASLAGLRRVPELMILPGTGSPYLCGLIRPRIVLPSDSLAVLNPDEHRHVILHEMLHMAHRDLAANWLLAAIRSLHWWNPLVHLTARRLLADRELLRDRQAVSLLRDPSQHSAYAHTLLKLATAHPAPAPSPGLAPFFRKEKEIHRRLTMLQSPILCSRPASAGLTFILAAIAFPVFSTVHRDDPPDGGAPPAAEPVTPSSQNDPLINFSGRGRISLAAPGAGSMSVPVPGGESSSLFSTLAVVNATAATHPPSGDLKRLYSLLTILRGLEGERLISVLHGLDEGGADFAKMYSECEQEKVELAAGDKSGMGPRHPKILALKESVSIKQHQLEAAAKQYVDLLELEWKGTATATVMADGARTVTTPHGPVQFTAPATTPDRAKALEEAIRNIFNAPAAPSGANASGPDELHRLRAEMDEMKAAIAGLRSSAAAAGRLAELQGLRSQIQRNEARGLGHRHPENTTLNERIAEIEKHLESGPAAGSGTDAALPFGIPEPGRKGMVRSPWAPETGIVDVTGLASGTIVQCPYTRNRFCVP